MKELNKHETEARYSVLDKSYVLFTILFSESLVSLCLPAKVHCLYNQQ